MIAQVARSLNDDAQIACKYLICAIKKEIIRKFIVSYDCDKLLNSSMYFKLFFLFFNTLHSHLRQISFSVLECNGKEGEKEKEEAEKEEEIAVICMRVTTRTCDST